MTRPIALVVDDDPQQTQEVEQSLDEAGFEVIIKSNAEAALQFAAAGGLASIDLCVLDRKLPSGRNDQPADGVGDDLFQRLSSQLESVRVIVFSGFTNFEHAQLIAASGGQILPQTDYATARITVLKKSQFEIFDKQVRDYMEILARLDDIELETDSDPSPPEKRMLRRIGFRYGASTVRAQRLTGGLTSASVWRCDMYGDGTHLSRVVAKSGSKYVPAGGLQELLPPGTVAARTGIVDDLTGGTKVSLMQVAGDDIRSLLSMVEDDPGAAANALDRVAEDFDGLDRTPRRVSLAELVAPLIDWSDAQALVPPHGIALPSGSMWVSSSYMYSHGDLHPGNVLVSTEGATVIDCDNQGVASALLDPITSLLSTGVHPDSPIRGSRWIHPTAIAETLGTKKFGSGLNSSVFLQHAMEWVGRRRTSSREFWGLAFGYASRQLRYPNLVAEPHILGIILAILRTSSEALRDDRTAE